MAQIPDSMRSRLLRLQLEGMESYPDVLLAA